MTEITTQQAAHHVGVKERSFHEWARRRGLRPTRQIRLGRATINLWSADAVFDATTTPPVSWRDTPNGRGVE